MYKPGSIDFSIIICSFNPDERLLNRCLQAIANFDVEEFNYEVILVDNNSKPLLNTFSYIQDFLNLGHSKYLIAPEQGLVYARIKGIEEADGKYIVFFDDDNEPEKDYLIQLYKLYTLYPNVAAWGPGNIWVEFIDGIPSSIKKSTVTYTKNIFQEKHESYITFANIRNWQSCYPYGTGLSIKQQFLKGYVQKTKQGAFRATGRKGSLLSSGEDLQMVLFCINESAAAGVSPSLKTKHLIPHKRAKFGYLKRLVFGTNLSFHPSLKEVLEEYQVYLENSAISKQRFQKKAFLKYISVFFSKDQVKALELIKYIALTCGSYLAIRRPIPKLPMWILRSLGISTKNLPI